MLIQKRMLVNGTLLLFLIVVLTQWHHPWGIVVAAESPNDDDDASSWHDSYNFPTSDDCGTVEKSSTTTTAPTRMARTFAEGSLLGGVVSLLAALLQWFLSLFGFKTSPATPIESYQLVNIPIVYHVLRNQDNGGRNSPSLTDAQRDFATAKTNQLFQIYDKQTGMTEPFVTFVTETPTVFHDTVFTNLDCRDLSRTDRAALVRTISEFAFKFHVIVCESNTFSGKASFPEDYPVASELHNLVRVDYRAMACYDAQGHFLCHNDDDDASSSNATTTQGSSHTRWWRSQSVVVAHEFGHLFGARHTFSGNTCSSDNKNDQVEDTPAARDSEYRGCPGLLPYDKDRDWFAPTNTNINSVLLPTNESCVAGEGLCGDNTCAACCNANNVDCPLYEGFEVVTEEAQVRPVCCQDSTPIDSCPLLAGIDPMNNVMSYVPDYCAHEFTVGQRQRMMEQTYQWKTYIYCNYVNKNDPSKCARVPCASTATSPNCLSR